MAADFKVYGFCENKCRREVMLKEDIEKRFKNLENELPGLSGIESVKTQTSVNKSKLDALKDLGKVVHSRKESWSANGSNMQVYSNYLTYVDLSSVLEDDADYMLVLSIDGEQSSPSILNIAGGFTDYRFTGHVIFNLYSGSKAIGSCQCTFTRGYGGSGNALGGFYIASLPIKKSDFANGRNLTLRCTPWILENTDGKVSLSSRTYTLNMYMDYKIIKVGYDLSVIEDEANLPEGGGTNDYNGLINKPMINGVTLEGELTAEDLGLGGSEGAGSLADLGVTASAKELNYMSGVTGPVQNQLNSKAAAVHKHDEYAAANHTHTEYAAATHSHTEYAAATHSHDQYSTTKILYSDTEPSEVAENTVVMVYEV